jgi:hypothetical protein
MTLDTQRAAGAWVDTFGPLSNCPAIQKRLDLSAFSALDGAFSLLLGQRKRP